MADKKQILFIILAAIGLIAWLGSTSYNMDTETDFEVEHLLISTGQDKKVIATLYIPGGSGQFPVVLFGAGSGTDSALYTNWGKNFVKQDIAILIVGPTYRKSDGGIPEWEIINDKDVILKEQTDQFATILKHLKQLPKIDSESIIVGGHSGGANTAYHLAYQNKDINGVFAVAGRYPPETSRTFPNNLLLITGAKDTIVPPSTLKDVGFKLSGKKLEENVLYGNFENNTAKKLFISENSGHLMEAFDKDIIQECLDFTLACLQKEQSDTKIHLTVLSSVLSRLAAGFLFLVSFIVLSGDYIRLKEYRKRIQYLIPSVYFLTFYLILSTTLSEYLRFLGPVTYRLEQYTIMAFIVIIIGSGLIKANKNLGLSNKASLILDFSLILISFSLFTLTYTQFAQFQLVTQIVIGLMISFLIIIPILVMQYTKIPFKARLVFTVLSLIWLVPAITPVY